MDTMIEFKNGKILYNGVDISNMPIEMFKWKGKKNYVLLEDVDEALWWIYVNDELVELYRCAFEFEAEKRLNEILDMMEQREYDMMEASMDMDGELEF